MLITVRSLAKMSTKKFPQRLSDGKKKKIIMAGSENLTDSCTQTTTFVQWCTGS